MKNTIFERALEHLNHDYDWTRDFPIPVFAVKHDDLGRIELELEVKSRRNRWINITLIRNNYADDWQDGDDFESYDYIEEHDFKINDYETAEEADRVAAEKMVEICDKYKLERAF